MSNRKWELMAPRSGLHGFCTTSLPLYVGDRLWSALATIELLTLRDQVAGSHIRSSPVLPLVLLG